MASYRFSMKTSKDTKAPANDHYDYIAREGRYEVGRKAEELVYKETCNLPPWAENDPGEFWRASYLYEAGNRTNFREIEISLPNELSREQQVELAKEFCREHFGKDFVYTMAVHSNEARLAKNIEAVFNETGEIAKGDLEPVQNPHVHIMFCERRLDGIERGSEVFFKRANTKKPELGGALKDRNWNGDNRPEHLKKLRESWAKMQNRALERNGHSTRVDHRSYEERGVDLEPEEHLGPEYADLVNHPKVKKVIDLRKQKELLKEQSQNQGKELEAGDIISLYTSEDFVEKFVETDKSYREIFANEKLSAVQLDEMYNDWLNGLRQYRDLNNEVYKKELEADKLTAAKIKELEAKKLTVAETKEPENDKLIVDEIKKLKAEKLTDAKIMDIYSNWLNDIKRQSELIFGAGEVYKNKLGIKNLTVSQTYAFYNNLLKDINAQSKVVREAAKAVSKKVVSEDMAYKMAISVYTKGESRLINKEARELVEIEKKLTKEERLFKEKEKPGFFKGLFKKGKIDTDEKTKLEKWRSDIEDRKAVNDKKMELLKEKTETLQARLDISEIMDSILEKNKPQRELSEQCWQEYTALKEKRTQILEMKKQFVNDVNMNRSLTGLFVNTNNMVHQVKKAGHIVDRNNGSKGNIRAKIFDEEIER